MAWWKLHRLLALFLALLLALLLVLSIAIKKQHLPFQAAVSCFKKPSIFRLQSFRFFAVFCCFLPIGGLIYLLTLIVYLLTLIVTSAI